MPPVDPWYDPRTTDEIIAAMLATPDRTVVSFEEDTYWSNRGVLAHRKSSTEFEAGVRLCASVCAIEQRLGCDVLAGLGEPDHPFRSESFEPIRSVLDRATDLETRLCTLISLGRLRDRRGVDALLDHLSHPADGCRAVAVRGLLNYLDDPRTATAMLELSRDWDPDVRDWATFGLALLTAHDSPAIRAALIERADDDIAEIRGEALRGLAERGDGRTFDLLARELGRRRISELAVEAAWTLNDPRCRALLIRLRGRFADWPYLNEAIRQLAPADDQ